jgi:GT2 family glycosyltransferase
VPSIAIILLSYGRAADTIDCIRSLRQSTYTNYEIIVVDNASPDGAADSVASACTGITLIRNDRNLGFAGGNNVGIRAALDRGAELILVLNNDTVVDPDMLGRLVKAAGASPRIGIVGAKILYADPPTMIWYAGGTLHSPSATTSHHGIGRQDTGTFDQPGVCTFVTGCAMLVPAEVWRRVGVFDAGFFAYLEDGDFCHRARCAGYELRYEPSARLYHKVSSTTAWDSPGYTYLNVRNKILFLRKHCLPWMWLAGIHRTAYYVVRQLFRALLLKRSGAALRAVAYGIADGLSADEARHGAGRLAGLRSAPSQSETT